MVLLMLMAMAVKADDLPLSLLRSAEKLWELQHEIEVRSGPWRAGEGAIAQGIYQQSSLHYSHRGRGVTCFSSLPSGCGLGPSVMFLCLVSVLRVWVRLDSCPGPLSVSSGLSMSVLVSGSALQKVFCLWWKQERQLFSSIGGSATTDATARARARATSVSIGHQGVPWLYRSTSPNALVSLQMYRQSVIAQWKAMNLDVVLTPMLGPALDLNTPGRATGEAYCPSADVLIPRPLLSSALCPVELWGRRGEVLRERTIHGGTSCSLGPH
jgi:hypothetical protein